MLCKLVGVNEIEWTVRIKITVRFTSSARLRAKMELYCQTGMSIKVLDLQKHMLAYL